MTPPDAEKVTPCEELPFGLLFCPMAIAGHVQQPHRKYVELSPHIRETLKDVEDELARLHAIEAAAEVARSLLLVKCSMSPVHSRDDHNQETCATCRAYAALNTALKEGGDV